MEVVERWIVGDVVWVEVVVVEVMLLLLLQPVQLGLWSSNAAQSWKLDLTPHLGSVDPSRGGEAAAGCVFDSVQDIWLRYAVPDGLIESVQVFLVGGPGLAARDGLQSVGLAGWGVRGGGGAAKVTLTQRGDPRAGATGQGGVTAIQDGLRTGGRGRYRVQGRLWEEGGDGTFRHIFMFTNSSRTMGLNLNIF